MRGEEFGRAEAARTHQPDAGNILALKFYTFCLKWTESVNHGDTTTLKLSSAIKYLPTLDFFLPPSVRVVWTDILCLDTIDSTLCSSMMDSYDSLICPHGTCAIHATTY